MTLVTARYNFHALHLPDLAEVTGFPVIIDGHYADNDHTRYFLGGTVLQRPALTSLNGVVIGAFGGVRNCLFAESRVNPNSDRKISQHCDLFNYTGMLVSVSKTPGVGVVRYGRYRLRQQAHQNQALIQVIVSTQWRRSLALLFLSR